MTKSKRPLPTASTERSLFRQGAVTVAGIDEVGRGAWAGPVAVGVAVVSRETLRRLPKGVRDSKQLSERARERLFQPLVDALNYAIGMASPKECDALGMTKAQQLATTRAFAALGTSPDCVILDGSHNYTDRSDVQLMVGADRRTLVVAAASILAKVTRDRMMISYAKTYPAYGFERNKGYASTEHRRAVARAGMTDIHRLSWACVPLCDDEEAVAADSPALVAPRL